MKCETCGSLITEDNKQKDQCEDEEVDYDKGKPLNECTPLIKGYEARGSEVHFIEVYDKDEVCRKCRLLCTVPEDVWGPHMAFKLAREVAERMNLLKIEALVKPDKLKEVSK